jgi:transglutaminase-like putative cysteine protease/tetratricopeptide (TPR) repeat protein
MNLAIMLSLALAGAAPWDAPPFSADPAVLAKAAAALPKPEGDGDIDLLLEEGTWTFDEAGRVTATLRMIYRPLSRDAAQSWGRVRRDWAPWHQQRPEIRARVILPSGEVRNLDPATLVEAGVQEDEDDEIYSDRRSLRGPLPAVDAGVVIEEVSTVRDVEPSFVAGSSYRFFFGWGPPTRLARLRVEAPAALPLRHALRNLSLKAKEQVKDGRRVIVWERKDSPVAPKREPWLPPDDAVTPHVVFGTSASWTDVADAYAAVVDQRLKGELPAALREAVKPGQAPERAAQQAMDWIGSHVRYTGLELGQAAIVPATPAETVSRGYGDCKDLSLLVVAALRAAGHDATIALVRSSWDELSPAVPGIGEFDHAIVRVGGPRPFFLDATDPDLPVGELPLAVQGRRALVAARGEKGLVTTQDLGPDRHRLSIVREVTLAEEGRAKVSDVREARGVWALDERHARRDVPPAKLVDWDQRQGKALLNTEEKVVVTTTGLDPLDGPVTVRREAAGSKWAIAEEHEAGGVVRPDALFEQLPSFMRPAPPQDGEEPEKHEKRRAPLVAPVAYSAKLEYRLAPPPGFRAVLPLPEDRDERWGPATFTARYAVTPAGAVTATYAFTLPRRNLTAPEAEKLYQEVSAYTTVDGPRVKFERLARALLAEGKGREAIAELQRLVAREPKAARHHNHLALTYLELGLGEAARIEARKAVALSPEDGWAYRVLAWVLQHDVLGRKHAPGCDLEGAVAALRRAVALEKNAASTRLTLARVLRLAPDGRLYGPGAKLAESAAEFQRAREAGAKDGLDEELEVALGAGRIEQAAALAAANKELDGRASALVAVAAVKARKKPTRQPCVGSLRWRRTT